MLTTILTVILGAIYAIGILTLVLTGATGIWVTCEDARNKSVTKLDVFFAGLAVTWLITAGLMVFLGGRYLGSW